jgi:YVTN family beta-propeller protein
MSARYAGLCCLMTVACATSPSVDGGASDAGSDASAPPSQVARHSSSIAIRPDGMELYVVNPDADSVSVIDPMARTLLHEIALGASPPAVDPTTMRFDPSIGPRALALAPMHRRLYVTGQWSSQLYEIDLATSAVTRHVMVGSEPIGVLVAPDESSVFVACAEDATVVRVDLASFSVAATAMTPPKPWALGWSSDGTTLYATHLLGPGISSIDPTSTSVRATWHVPDVAFRGDRLLAYGEVRGLYDVVARPGTTEIWTPHLLLATQTVQATAPTPGLDFESTVFPGVAILGTDGSITARMTVDTRVPGVDGQFGDIVSGPHAIAMSADGAFAFVVDTNSEDVLVIDAAPDRRVQSSLLRPLPGHTPEGLVLSPDGTRLYVDERTSTDVAVIDVTMVRDIASGRMRPQLTVDGAPIARLAHDPMPAQLRLGQQLFHSANSDAFAITMNHWVACASCHIEARSDAVVWRFIPGPRDTPSNAGGVLHTGFLLHTADRREMRDYWHTINDEQGSSFSITDPTQSMQLDALAAFVNLAIHYPVPPHTDPAAVARGMAIFTRSDVQCATCHQGAYFTDSGLGNPTLDLGGTVLLHDVGTCNTGVTPLANQPTPFADVAHTDVASHPRAPCMFDTPSLRGVASSWPYFHDGSAATLHDVLEQTRGHMGNITSLTAQDEADLIEYMRSL